MQIAKALLYRSTLSTISSLINEARDAEQARASIVEQLTSTAPKGRKKVVDDIKRLETLEEIFRHTQDALTKYERLAGGVKAL
jgi:hypothetical protein